MRYKIAAIIGARRNAVIFPILEGIWECCAQENADLYAFVCYSSDSIDSTSSEGENNVFNLIQAEEYDGFILACQNIYSKTVNEKLQKLLLESGKPCISLEEDIDGMYYASIDNYSLMKEMTEHLINEHGCRILNYIGGPADNHENIARRNGFRSALKEAGIEPEERRIQSWSWDYTDGIEAFNYCNSNGLLDGDAYLCANDRLAAGFIFEAHHFGYRIPEDFIVTGFDNNSHASVIYPLLTTVDRNRTASGKQCCSILMKAIRKETLPHFTKLDASLVLSQSCGCNYSDHEKNRIARNAQTESSLYKESLTANIYAMERTLSGCNNAAEYYSTLYKYIANLKCASFYLMISESALHISAERIPSFRKEGYDEFSSIRLAVEDDVRVPEKEITFPTRQLLPFRLDSSGHLYLISPLHFQDQCLGYCVSADTLSLLEYNRHFDWMNAVDLTLSIVREKRTLLILNDKLNLLYMIDPMTGLYNRFGYTMKAMDIFQENILSRNSTMVMFLDIDNLKAINDNFGHEHGDLAIRTAADTIRAEIPEDFIPVRYGGDEFVVIGKCNDAAIANALRDSLISHLNQYNRHSANRYQVTVSIGYTIAKPGDSRSLDDYVKQADAIMYEAKKQFKAKQLCIHQNHSDE